MSFLEFRTMRIRILSYAVMIMRQNYRLLSNFSTSKYENPLLQLSRLLTWIFQKLKNVSFAFPRNHAKYYRITRSIRKVTSILAICFFDVEKNRFRKGLDLPL